jgi:hypothetical protein
MHFQSFILSAYKKYLVLILLLLAGGVANAQETILTVISNTKGAPSEMTMSELRTVLKGEKQRWNDGTKVYIALMKTSTPAGQSTCQKVYHMSGDNVKRHWLALSFSGHADAPTFCNTAAELESFVSQNPGAIGLTGSFSGGDEIKITKIDGKSSF